MSEHINAQTQVPGAKGEHGVFRTLNGREIRWTDRTGLVHFCAGADVHPSIRLIWTLCERNVPADKAWLPGDEDVKGGYEVCIICLKRANEMGVSS